MFGTTNREVVTRLLTELADERHRVADALLAMDGSDDGLAYLRTATLAGATRDFWDRLRQRIDVLWAAFRALGAALDGATGGQPLGRLTRAQLTSISAHLFAPVADDALPDVLRTLPVVQLGQWLEEECRAVRAELTGVSERLAAVNGLRVLESALDAAERAAGAGGDAVAAALRDLRDRAGADPLGTDLTAAAATSVIATTEATIERLNRLAARRAGYADRRTALAASLTRLASEEADAQDSYARATEKICDPRLPPEVTASPGLRSRLDALGRLDVTALDRALPDLERTLAAALGAAVERREFADGLLARREELRGRLDSYRAKAVRSGRSERPEVLAAYASARALLWTAPCDLAAATRAVAAYQRTLVDRPGGGGA